jgi:hypothetical protein
MTQEELYDAVAQHTGEDIATIARLGFSLADSLDVCFDPEGFSGRYPSNFDDATFYFANHSL